MHQRGSYLHSELVLGIFLVIKEDFEWQLFARHVGNSLWKPVESAGDAAARLARVNEELGAMLYGGIALLMWDAMALLFVNCFSRLFVAYCATRLNTLQI